MNGVIEGRIVHYVLSDRDVADINNSREVSMESKSPNFGNFPKIGEHVPMMIVRVFVGEFGQDHPGVNGKCFLDGNDSLWVTSRKFDEAGAMGTWHWVEKA